MRSSLTISPEFLDLHTEYAKYGKYYIKDKSILCVGLARDVEKTLANSIERVLSLNNFCRNVDIFIVENDSIDNTKNILSEYSIRYKNQFSYISDNDGFKKYGTVKDIERTIGLAKYRNKYIEHIKVHKDQYDYIMVVDWDFLDFNNIGLFNTFGWISQTNISAMCGISLKYQNVLSANHKNYWNYDCWAYRGNWWQDKQKEIDDCNSMLWFGFWIPPIGSPPLKINSGFGGMCIYQTDHMIQSRYDGYDCEHVCFHKNLSETVPKFNLHINPSQIMLLA